MKRTCDNCKALEYEIGYCKLKKKIKEVYKTIDFYYYIPLEECEKPLTFKRLVEISLKSDFENSVVDD